MKNGKKSKSKLPRGKVGRGPGMKAGGKTKKMRAGGQIGVVRTTGNPVTSIPGRSRPSLQVKTGLRPMPSRPIDPVLPRGKKGRGDI